MWYRLKSSLLTAAIATALVMAFLAIAEPAERAAAPASPLHGLTGLDIDSERAAFQLAVSLAALSIDAAVEARNDAARATATLHSAAPAPRSPPGVRMPFYSFAAKSTPRTES